MIDTYGDKLNPCNLCTNEEDEEAPKNKEYLEFSLTGNDTTLIVREVSLDDVTKQTDEELSVDEISEPLDKAPSTKVHPTPLSKNSSKTFKLSKSSLNSKSQNNRRLDALYTKKWSGKTYFEEEIRRLQEQQYNNELREAMKMRKLWHKFQKELLQDRRRDLVKSSGPEWWQEPSTKQIVLATTLKDVIRADYEEGVTGRIRQWLLDLGVVTRLTPREVKRCMKRSLLEPVDFLLDAHALVVKAQSKKNGQVKKKGHLGRPFSVDERLLLTAVCVLQLPTLLWMLHYILPPPKSYPTNKYIQELLYGNLDDETIRYSTPYMEPLPFRNRVDFEDWAFGKICSALLPVLLKDDRFGHSLRKSVLSENISSDVKKSLSIPSLPLTLNRLSVHSAAPSVAILLSYCLAKRLVRTESTKALVDDESVHHRTFGRRLTLLGKSHKHIKLADTFKIEQNENTGGSFDKSLDTEPTPSVKDVPPTPVKIEDFVESPPPTQEYMPDDEYYWANQPWQGEYAQQMQGYPYQYPTSQYYDNNIGLYDQQVDYTYNDNPQISQSNERVKTLSRTKTLETVQSKTSSKVTVEQTRSDIQVSLKSPHKEPEDHGSLRQLENIWEEIEACPEKEQLPRAIKILTEMGDPLAQLPKIEKLPTIQRWLELRRGKNRILSKQTKEELLNRSRGMWKSVHFGSLNKGPKVEMSKRKERKLTWEKKKWLDSEVKKEKVNYFSRLRQEKVDNARAFFPTMLNHYDYGSKLNRNFRDVFFTYLPAREADTFAYRPWQPQETRNSKS